MKATILEGDVFSRLSEIAPGSVDCVVTSPPYFALRDYSGCPCVVKGRKRPGCTNCDEAGKVPVVRDNQIGMEKTPEEYVEKMVQVFHLVRECMSQWAVAFVNIGDTYSTGASGMPQRSFNGQGYVGERGQFDSSNRTAGEPRGRTPGIPAGNLCLIPQRLALALQADGWIVRSVVCWVKPSPMPQSVAGWRWMRCRKKIGDGKRTDTQWNQRGGLSTHCEPQWADCPGCKKCQPHGGLVLRRGSWRPTSSWEPVLMLAKQSGYFADGESVKTPAQYGRREQGSFVSGTENGDGHRSTRGTVSGGGGPDAVANLRDVWRSTLADMSKEELIALIESQADGSLPDVWTISSEPLHEKHYAAFPSRLVELCLRAGTSARGYCQVCGAPWCRVVKTTPVGDYHGTTARGLEYGLRQNGKGPMSGKEYADSELQVETLGWRATCSCPEAEPRPGLCLDPFAGSGRTGLVARKLGLDFVGVELAPGYVQMARRLLHDDLPLFSDLPSE